MTTHSAASRHSDAKIAGSITLALGVLFAAAVGFAYVLSLSDSFNPPNWVRAIGLMWLPIGLGGVPIGYFIAHTGEGRNRARLGVLIGVVGLVSFAGLVVTIG